ncbi:MAG: S8 family peptidase, partial [Candidatus Scalinduaceae bacterium]
MIKNKKIFCLFMIILSVTIMIQLSHAEGLPEFVEDELLIKFKDTVSAESIQTCENDHNIEFVKEFSQFKVFLHRIRDGRDVISVCNDLNNDPRIEYAEPNYIQKVDAVPNDPMYDQLWGMNNTGQTGGTPDADIDAPEAWDINKGGSNIVVGVIDTGVDYNHEDLAANMWVNSGEIPENGIDDDGNEYIDDIHGIDAFNNDGDPFDDNGHGTHVSGTIGAVGNNGIGVVGVNWNVKIMALKFLGAGGSGSTAGAIECLDYVTMMKNNFGVNIKLTNNSWGGGGFSQALKDAIEASGILFAAAAGNDAVDNDIIPHYPANYDSSNILAVASTDHNDGLSSFSNFGLQSVDIGAPGSSILSTKPGNTYAVHSGTSMATPHASGVAALLVAANPALSFSELKSKIMSSTDPIPALSGKTVTGGRLNAQSALIVFSNIGDEVIIDFGPGTGIWVRKNDAGWIQLHPSSPVSMVTGDMDGN